MHIHCRPYKMCLFVFDYNSVEYLFVFPLVRYKKYKIDQETPELYNRKHCGNFYGPWCSFNKCSTFIANHLDISTDQNRLNRNILDRQTVSILFALNSFVTTIYPLLAIVSIPVHCAIDCPERLVAEMTCYVSSGTLNSTHTLTHSVL